MDILVLFGTFILLVILTIPIGYAIGISTLVTLVFFTNMPLALITQNAITGVDSFPLMAIPFFMLAGNLYDLCGHLRLGHGHYLRHRRLYDPRDDQAWL